MKAEKFAVTKMTHEQLIKLILSFYWLFPHLMSKKGTKRDPTAVNSRRRRPLLTPPPPSKQAKSQSGVPPASIKLTPELLKLINTPSSN